MELAAALDVPHTVAAQGNRGQLPGGVFTPRAAGLESAPPAAGAEERPITVIPPGVVVPVIPAVPRDLLGPQFRPLSIGADAQTRTDLADALGNATEVLVIDPTRIYYTDDEVGATVVSLLQTAKARLPGFTGAGMDIRPLAYGEKLAAYSIVVKTQGQPLDREAEYRANRVAIIELTGGMTFAQIIQQALAQWTGKPIGQVLGVQYLEDGRLAIYV